MEKTNRLQSLEGLRGLAAISVVIYHALLMFYAYMFFGPGYPLSTVQNMRFEDNLYGSPLSVLLSGTFAVSIFFVISGFVLSIGFFETGKTTIIKKLAAKRYLRLMIPALASVLLAWLVISLGLSRAPQASAITHSGWLAGMWAFVPNLFDAIQQGTWGIFTTTYNYYNPVLWTMLYEFLGSFFVFGTLLLFGRTKKRALVYAALVVGLYHTWYFGFIIGMVLADLYAHNKFPFDRPHIRMMVILLGFAVLFGSYPLGAVTNTIYATFSIPGISPTENGSIFTALGAACIVIASLNLPVLVRFLSLSRISHLGKYTYSLYLVHKPILFSLCAGLFLLFYGVGVQYNVAAVLALVITAPVIIVVTILFERYIDTPAILWSGIFANWLLDLPQKQGVAAYTARSKKPLRLGVVSRLKTRFRIRKRSP